MENNTDHIEFLSDLRSEILRAGWPSMVGAALSCRQCGSILDCRRAGDITVKVGGRVRFSNILCSACFDQVLEKAQALTPESIGAGGEDLTVEVIDGRVVMGGAR